MVTLMWYVIPLLVAGAIGLWQWRVDVRFKADFDRLTWEEKMAYLRARKLRTLVMVVILAVYLTVVRGGVFDRPAGAP